MGVAIISAVSAIFVAIIGLFRNNNTSKVP